MGKDEICIISSKKSPKVQSLFQPNKAKLSQSVVENVPKANVQSESKPTVKLVPKANV